METNKIHNQNCLDFMRNLPDNYFDLIITDPPYGIERNKLNMGKGNIKAKGKHIDYGNYEWDKSIPSEEVFIEMLRVSRNQIIFGGNYMTQYLNPSSCWIVWDKVVDDKFSCDFADCELAWTSFNKASRVLRYVWRGLMQGKLHQVGNRKYQEKRVHPTQKPVALGLMILEKFAKKGDKIFDPFAGSGSFLVACKQLGFTFVGCEINKTYVDIAERRLCQNILSEVSADSSQP